MNDRADHVFHRAFDRPVAVSGSGSTITTSDGRAILDGAGGAIASSIGHGRTEVVEAMAAQASLLEYVHSTQFTTESVARFAAHVAEIVPMEDARVFPVSGGSEANETALKLARAYHLAHGETDRHIVLARFGAYHGNTRGVLDASNRASVTVGYEPWLGQTVRVPLANPYRDQRTGAEHAAEIDRIIQATGPGRVAALIADEVMTGFGRTGRWFGMDNWGVRPDILTSGKGASSGYWPLGLCVASGHVYDTVDEADTFSHGFTWSHHPVGAAVADTVLTIIQREGLVERSRLMGERCRDRLHAALGDHPNVGEVRGIGLLNAVEFVADRETKQPFDRADGVTERINAAAFERDLTLYPCTSAVDGNVGDAVLLGPPLSVSEDDLDEMVDRLVASVQTTLPG